MAWKLYPIEPTAFIRRVFRRFVFSGPERVCPVGYGYHDASVIVEERSWCDAGTEGSTIPEDEKADPRWPSHCACGYMFQLDDQWQDNRVRLWSGAPDGREYVLSDKHMPPGAYRKDDNLLYIRMPDGEDFCPNFPGREQWSMSGELPLITISPSIHAVGTYHGHIIAGVLGDDGDGRKFTQFPPTA